MNRGHALRYLLLKHLWKQRHLLEGNRHRAIARSLTVTDSAGGGWFVEWRDGVAPGRFEIPPTTVHFYKPGDSPQSLAADPRLDRETELAGERFVTAITGVAANPRRGDAVLGQVLLPLGGTLAVIAAMSATAPGRFGVAGIALASAAILEFVPNYGRRLVAPALAVLVFAGLPFVAILANGVAALLQWLDPDPRARWIRVGIHAVSVVAVLFRLVRPAAPAGWLVVATLAVWALAVGTLRWIHGAHRRIFPLLLPFVCPALAIEGLANAAICGLAGASLGLAFVMLRRGKAPL